MSPSFDWWRVTSDEQQAAAAATTEVIQLKTALDYVLGQDLIIETILTKLPIKDAVRTCSLASKWRYKWPNLTQLVFDDNCATLCNDKGAVEDSLAKFITRFLFLHDGPNHKFSLIVNSPCLQELQISGSSNTSIATEAPDLDFCEKECPV